VRVASSPRREVSNAPRADCPTGNYIIVSFVLVAVARMHVTRHNADRQVTGDDSSECNATEQTDTGFWQMGTHIQVMQVTLDLCAPCLGPKPLLLLLLLFRGVESDWVYMVKI
jgi:hypothetical protein